MLTVDVLFWKRKNFTIFQRINLLSLVYNLFVQQRFFDWEKVESAYSEIRLKNKKNLAQPLQMVLLELKTKNRTYRVNVKNSWTNYKIKTQNNNNKRNDLAINS